MKFEHLDISDDKDLVIIKRKSICAKLKRIQNAIHKRDHHSYCYTAVYDAMETRCIVHSNTTEDLVIKSIFDKMIKEYETGKIDWSGSFSAKEFNPLMHMFVKGQISEC